MNKLFCFLILISFAFSHPSWGIVVMKNGDIYFVDIFHGGDGSLWKLDANNKLTSILKNFHAHHLQLDIHGNLWIGDQKWIQGVIEGDGQHTLVKITPDGKHHEIAQHRDYDKFNATNFAVDSKGTVLFSRHGQISTYQQNAEGKIINPFQFKRIMSLFMDTSDHLWIADNSIDQGSIYRLSQDGKLIQFAKNILPVDPKTPIFKEKHVQILSGMFSNHSSHVYVANNSSRTIDKFNGDGTRQRIHQSDATWYPVGVSMRGDHLIIMECGYDRSHKGPRVLSKSPSGEIEILIDLSDK